MHLLSANVLFVRWSVVQLGGVLIVAAGARLALNLDAFRSHLQRSDERMSPSCNGSR